MQQDWIIRGGLGRTGDRLRRGDDVTIAFFGGSITWGGHASDIERTSYRARLTAWLRGRYPAATIRTVNAAIGGTGSDLGAYRLRRDVLRHQPDLIIVEFAVNDSGRSDATIRSAMEGIVRASRQSLPHVELCLVYTLAKDHLESYGRGEMPRTVGLHEAVAEHYDLASVHMARHVARELAAGRTDWSSFSADTCHPTDAGFAMFSDVLVAAWPAMLDAPPRDGNVLPQPISDDPWDQADLRPVRPDDATDGWRYQPMTFRGGWDCFEGLLISDRPGDVLQLPFEGGAAGLLYQLGPDSGDLEWAIDDAPMRTLRIFDDFAASCWRPHFRILASDLPPGRHTLRVALAPTRDSRATGHDARIGYLLHR